jgi:ABC-type nitrate/sulfonate/bicarbonate transport system substrate-binding protein
MARTKKSGVLRSALAGGAGAVLVAALAACSSGSSSGSSGSAAAGGSGGAKSLGTVTLAMGSKSANMSLGFIAAEDGLFKQNGLNVKLVYAGTGALATAALVSGSAQFAMGGGQGFFTAQASGQHLYMLAKGGSGLGTQLVLTPAAAKKTGLTSSSTTAEKVKALNGLTIASASASSSWTAQANKAAATQGAKIKWTYIAETALAAAMKRGNIDGLVAAPPWTTQVLFNKTADMWLNGPAGSFPGGFAVPSYGDPLVATTKAYTTAHPAVVRAFTKSIMAASELVNSNPTKAAAYVKQVAYPTMSQSEFQQVWAATLPLLHTPSLSLQSLKATLALDGDTTLDASAMYPGKILSAVGSG